MKKFLIGTLCALTFTTSCDKDDTPNVENLQNQYCFTSQINPASRAIDSGFETDDLIGVTAAYDSYFEDKFAENVRYEFNGSKFTSSTPIEYVANTESAFRAVYPYQSDANDDNFTFDINSDQSTYENYTLSDLMTAQTELTSLIEPTLTFSHRLSLVTINITDSNVNIDNATATVNAKTSVDVDLTKNSYTAAGEAQNITTCDNGTNSFKVIVAPQTIAAQTKFITINTSDDEYSFTLTSDIELLSGKQYTYTGVISATNELIITSTINPWEDGGELNENSSENDQELEDTQYSNWIGTWQMTSASSTVSGKAITTTIVIKEGDTAGENFYIYGWDLSAQRWNYPLLATFDTESGGWQVMSQNFIATDATLGDIYYKAKAYVEAPYNAYYFIDKDYTALEASTDSNGSNATVSCNVNQITDGTSFTVATLILAYGNDNVAFAIDSSLGLDANEMLVGPFSMTKSSNSIDFGF